MPMTWIVLANGRRARLFERDGHSSNLHELANFIFPYPGASPAQGTQHRGSRSKGHGRTAHAGTQMEPRTPTPQKARRSFARQIAGLLSQGVYEQRCDRVAVIASAPMLGALIAALTPVLADKLCCTVCSDLTQCSDTELRFRVMQAVPILA